MIFISQIIKKDVFDINGKKIGIIKDFVVSRNETYPTIKAMTIDISKKEEKTVTWDSIENLGNKIKLNSELKSIQNYQIKKDDINLMNILDIQIIDSNGKKIGRVNDIELSPIDGNYQVIGLGIGLGGITRRLGIENILKDLRIKIPGEYITWKDVDISGSDQYNLTLKVADSELKKLHPSDIAEIIKELKDKDLATIINSLDEDIAASVLEEISSDRQICLLDGMDNKKTASILNKMSPDSATDLFGCLSKDKSNELLDLMDPDEASDIRKLLIYPPDTAGGIMTTEFAVVNEEYTTLEVLDYLRNIVKEVKFIYYVYLVSNGILMGIASLKDIIFAEPTKKVNEFMTYDLITVGELDNQNDVAKKIAKYNLLAIPVINDKKELKGIVTVDDVLDISLKSQNEW